MVAKIDFSQFGHVALFVFVCRELWKNFPKKPEKKCWSQSFEISNWNILQDILITFFFQRSFSDTWKRLKMIVAFYFELLFFGKELFVTMYVILELGTPLSVCREVYWRHPCVPWYGFCLDSVAITGSKKHISSSNGMINLENLKSEKEIKSCVIVKLQAYLLVCLLVFVLFRSDSFVCRGASFTGKCFFLLSFKGQPYYVRIKGTVSLNGLFSIISIQW